MREVKKAALIGGGVIGAAWAARLVINGVDVCLFDPAPQTEARVRAVLQNALRAYARLTLAPVAARGEMTFAKSAARAVKDADFVQESGPERMELKRELMREICDNTAADVVVASSSSGLLPSDLQRDMRHPERVLIGHPFNPVYLLPLVEIVGGEKTSNEARRAAETFYASLGMQPLQVKKEIDAFIADRLMESLWREALHLVNDDVADVDAIDRAIAYGPGLRWAFIGPFLTYRIAGGEGGMQHFMRQFGPSLKWPWARFDAPELDDALIEKITAQSDAQAGGKSIAELERMRDDCLVSLMQGLRSHDVAAGATLKQYEEKLYAVSHTEMLADDATPDAPLNLHTARVLPEWVDYNNHMTESRYLQVFGDASDALFRYIGVDAEYHAAGLSFYTVETHIHHLREAAVDTPLKVTTQVLGCDAKRIHVLHTIIADDESQTVFADAEQMLLHVDTAAGKVCAARDDVLARAKRIAAVHAALPQPDSVGKPIRRVSA